MRTHDLLRDANPGGFINFPLPSEIHWEAKLHFANTCKINFYRRDFSKYRKNNQARTSNDKISKESLIYTIPSLMKKKTNFLNSIKTRKVNGKIQHFFLKTQALAQKKQHKLPLLTRSEKEEEFPVVGGRRTKGCQEYQFQRAMSGKKNDFWLWKSDFSQVRTKRSFCMSSRSFKTVKFGSTQIACIPTLSHWKNTSWNNETGNIFDFSGRSEKFCINSKTLTIRRFLNKPQEYNEWIVTQKIQSKQ